MASLVTKLIQLKGSHQHTAVGNFRHYHLKRLLAQGEATKAITDTVMLFHKRFANIPCAVNFNGARSGIAVAGLQALNMYTFTMMTKLGACRHINT